MTKPENIHTDELLLKDIMQLIEEARAHVASTVNAALTLLFWNIGYRIHQFVLQQKRAEYGKQIVVTLSRQIGRKADGIHKM